MFHMPRNKRKPKKKRAIVRYSFLSLILPVDITSGEEEKRIKQREDRQSNK